MSKYAFSSRSNCPLPLVPIIDVDLIEDCDIPKAPPPIWENPDLPVPIPPELSIGCPPIEIETKFRDDLKPEEDPYFYADFSPAIDDDNCFPRLTFDLGIRPTAGGFCVSVTKEGEGNVVADIIGSVIKCDPQDPDSPEGLLLELYMDNVQGGGGCGCYFAVYCDSSSSCASLVSLGPQNRFEAVSSEESREEDWAIGTDFQCLQYDHLTRLVFSHERPHAAWAYYRTMCIDHTGMITKVSKETRYDLPLSIQYIVAVSSAIDNEILVALADHEGNPVGDPFNVYLGGLE